MTADELMFFDAMPGALPLYAALAAGIRELDPDVAVRTAKTQITFQARYGFAFVSLRRIRGCPEVFLILTLGLGRRLDSPRVAVAVEPYPGRWTHHFILSDLRELDDELWSWVREAHGFAQTKGNRRSAAPHKNTDKRRSNR